MKKKNIKKSIIIGLLFGIVIGVIGTVSYAAYTYSKTGGEISQLIAGEIYMKYTESQNVININNAMPSTTYDNSKYFEFDIVGKNTSNRDIWYEIVLTDGVKPNNKNTKLDDKFLRFTLYQGNNMVVDGASFSDITNQRLYTGSVSKNTNSETTTTYKLYAWIDNSVGIGTGTDYTIAEWNDIWAAVKVNVNARTETSSKCFTLSNKDDTNHTATISAYDVSCGGTDIIIPKVIDGYTITEYGSGAFASKGLTNAIMQEGIVTINAGAFYGNQLTSLEIPNSVTTIGDNAFFGNQIIDLTLGNSVQTIGQSTFQDNLLTTVTIPNSVTSIGSGAFVGNQLTIVTLGNHVETILSGAFYGGTHTYNTITYGSNQIASVTIPASVNTMYCNAFANQGNGINTQITYENPSFSCSN